MTRSIFSGMQILADDTWLTHQAVVVEQGKIKAILPENMISHHLPAKHYQFHADHYLIPGLIDLHIHGAAGKDIMDASVDALSTICQTLAREGITTFLATTMTADPQQLEKVLTIIAHFTSPNIGAALYGVHMEGPFISPDKIGAQHPQHVQLPHPGWVQHWQNIANEKIKLMTLAPELPGAIELIDTLRQLNIIASIGHSNASYQETMNAIKAGCTQATHLFNAMRIIHQREPGVAIALLMDDSIATEIIADGFHLHPAMIEMVFKLKDKHKILLVTDAMRAKCMRDGTYELGGQAVAVKAGKATLTDGQLAGSTLQMPQAIKNMVQFSRCTLADAVNMATANPAKVLGIGDRKGSIMVGKDADLVVLNANLAVQLTIREGQDIYHRS